MHEAQRQPIARSVSEGIVFGTVGATVIKASMLASSIIVLRSLTVPQYGLWVLAISMFGLFYSFGFDSLDRLILAHMAHARSLGHGIQGTFRDYARAVLLTNAVLTLLFLGFANLSGAYKGPHVVVTLLGVTFLTESVKRICRVYFYAELAFRIVALLDAALRITYLGLVVLFVLMLRWELVGIASAHALASALGAGGFGLVFLLVRKTVPLLEDEKSLGALIRRQGRWVAMGQVVHDVSRNAMPWVVAGLLGVHAAGLFGFARNLFSEVANLVPLSTILVPVLAHESHDQRRFFDLSARAFKYSIWLGAALVVGMLLAKPVLAFLFPTYTDALPLFYLMLSSLPFQNPSIVLLYMLNSAQRQREIFIADATKPIFVVTVFLGCTWAWGIWGAALAILVYSAVLLVARYLLVWWTLNWTFPPAAMFEVRMSDWRQLLRLLKTVVQRPTRQAASTAGDRGGGQ